MAVRKQDREVYEYYLTSRSLCLIPYSTHKKGEDISDGPIPRRQVFKLIYKTTTDATTKFFQLKILRNFLPTRKMLKIGAIAESDECRFCFVEYESTEHLFWCCHVVFFFWRDVQRMCNTMELNVQLNFLSVLLGDVSETESYITNFIILLGKRFLFKADDKGSLKIYQFIMFIKRHFILEGYIAKGSDDQNQNI